MVNLFRFRAYLIEGRCEIIKIYEKFADARNYASEKPRALQKIRYLVVHYTGNDGDTARANATYFAQNAPGVSAHYFVDACEIWHSVPDNFAAWHCGTKGAYYHSACRNGNSIGIELCAKKDTAGRFVFAPQTLARAQELLRVLMTRHNIAPTRVLRHYDVTHKTCPEPFVRDAAAWQAFVRKLAEKKEDDMVLYKTWADVPDWGKDTVAKLTRKGLLRGDEGYLNLEHNALRNLVINDRAGLYGE